MLLYSFRFLCVKCFERWLSRYRVEEPQNKVRTFESIVLEEP